MAQLFAQLPISLLLGIFFTFSAQAAPLFLKGTGLAPLLGSPRSAFVAFTPKNAGWESVPLQWDELEEDGFLVVRAPQEIFPVREKINHPKDRDPFQGKVSKVHRLAIDHAALGTCDGNCRSKAATEAGKICAAAGKGASAGLFAFDVAFGEGTRTAFLARCEKSQKEIPQEGVAAEANGHTVKTELYTLKMASENPALFDSVGVLGQAPLLSGAILKVTLKPKYFFNMSFERSDLSSHITAIKKQPLSTVLEFSTTLKNALANLVSIKQVCCDVSAFRDFATAPLIFEIPSQLGKLGSGSQVFLGFAQMAAEPKVDLTEESLTLAFPATDGNSLLLSLRTRMPHALAKAKILQGPEAQTESPKTKTSPAAQLGILVPLDGNENLQNLRLDMGFAVGKDPALLKEILLEHFPVTLRRL